MFNVTLRFNQNNRDIKEKVPFRFLKRSHFSILILKNVFIIISEYVECTFSTYIFPCSIIKCRIQQNTEHFSVSFFKIARVYSRNSWTCLKASWDIYEPFYCLLLFAYPEGTIKNHDLDYNARVYKKKSI